MESSRSKPVKVFRCRGISASVFSNETRKGETFFKICLQRTWYDGENYKTSDSFGRDEVPVAVLMMQQAWQYVLESEAETKKETAEGK